MKKSYRRVVFSQVKYLITCLAILSFTITTHAGQINESPQMPVGGRLVFTGSVALSNLISDLAQSFTVYNPLITVTIANPGGMAGLDALINGSADMVLSSTQLNDRQQQQFQTRYGYAPEYIPIAMDALAVYVNNLNSLYSITLQELDGIFSSTYRCGEAQPIQTWDAFNVKGILAHRQIHIYGLTVNTGASSLFRQTALCGGDFKKDFQALVGSASIELALTSDYAGIGFVNSALRSSELHTLAISPDKKSVAVAPTPETIRSGQYPMSRTLSIVINHRKGQPVPPVLQAFIDFARSPEGLEVIEKAGYVTLPKLSSSGKCAANDKECSGSQRL